MNREQYARMRSVEDRHWWYVGMRAIVADLLSRLPLGADARILDAGCGTGGSLPLLGRFGRVVGLDISEVALDLAADRGGVLLGGSVAELPFLDRTFDLVTSFEVLYHRAVGDDVAALCELRRVMRPRAFLLLRLPAFEWLRGAHDQAVHTARRYTGGELDARLRTAGLDPVRITYANGLLLPLVVAKRLAERVTRAGGDDLAPPPAVVEQLFSGALALERRLLRRMSLPVGVSLLALARRPA